MTIVPNALYHADCIEVIQRIDEESINLVYLDPLSFTYFRSQHPGSKKSAYEATHHYLQFLSKVCQQAHRVLRQTGVLFFHTQPADAFSIRLILDQVFGEANFRSEIVWQYRRGVFSRSDRPGPQHDTILLYSKSDNYTYNLVRRSLNEDEIKG
jgi:site-specific DNA-methyltransferase (adenine-specific)